MLGAALAIVEYADKRGLIEDAVGVDAPPSAGHRRGRFRAGRPRSRDSATRGVIDRSELSNWHTTDMRLKRQAAMFKAVAIESLTLSVELFNRPSGLAREHAVIMMLAHAFEMLLKAIIFQQRGTVRDRGDNLSHSLNRCIDICVDDLQSISREERTLLLAVKQDRDCATHDVITMSEEMLWVHMRGGITIFRRLLKDEFSEELTELLPGRVIPVSATPPSDLGALVESEMRSIKEMLQPGKRRTAEAAARLRPFLSLDGSVTGRSDQPTESEVTKAERQLRDGQAWREVFPGLAQLSIGSAYPGQDAQEVVLRIGKDADAVPVRRAAPGETGALAYRGISPFEEFGIKLSEFGNKLGVTRHEGYAIVRHLNLKDDERAYFVKRNKSGNVVYQGLSARALELGRRALADPEFDLAAVTAAYNQRNRRARGIS